MAGEYFRLGDIDCLQQTDVSQALGDTQVRMTYPGYRDTMFNGIGLQAPFLAMDLHEALFHPDGDLHHIRRAILQRAGVWQVECPELRSRSLQEGFLYRKQIGWHVDDREHLHLNDRVLLSDSDCTTFGETDITTRRMYMLLTHNLASIDETTRLQLQEALRCNKEYSRKNDALLNNIPLSKNWLLQPLIDAREHTDSIVRHFYRPDDPSKPEDINAYSTLAWDNAFMVHGATTASGKIISRKLIK